MKLCWQNFRKSLNLLFFLFSLIINGITFAAPAKTTYQARIIKPDGTPLQASNVSFRFTITNPTGQCVLYSEDYSLVNMSGSGGQVNFSLGNGVVNFAATSGTQRFAEVFDNTRSSGFTCKDNSNYIPTSNDIRKIVMQFNDGNGWQTLPAMAINSVPFSMFASKAEDAKKFDGKTVDQFAQVQSLPSCTTGQQLQFNGINFSCVTPAASGLQSFTSNKPSILQVGGTLTDPTLDLQVASTTQDGYLLSSDFITFSGKMNNTASAVISALGFTPISSNTARSIAQTEATAIASAAVASAMSSQVLAGDVSGNFNSTIVDQVGGKSATQISTSVNDTQAASANNTASVIAKRTSDKGILADYFEIYRPSSSFAVRLSAPTSLAASYTLTLPTTQGSNGQVLAVDNSGQLNWINPSTGSVTSVTGASGQLVTTGTSSSVTIGLATTGVASATYGSANKIPVLAVDSFGRVQSAGVVDFQDATNAQKGLVQVGSNISISGGVISISNANVVSALGYTPADQAAVTSALTNYVQRANNLSDLTDVSQARNNLGLQALALKSSIDLSTSDAVGLLPLSKLPSGVLTSATALAGDVTGNYNTTSINTIQGRAVSLSALSNGQILQVSGSAVRNITLPSCAANQYLTFNGTSWSCANDAGASGSVTQINTGAGLTGGPITSTGTISLATTSVTAATYGSANTVPVFTVDQYGRITGVTSATTSVDWANITSKPTTLAGYGITDALSKTLTQNKILIGNNSNQAIEVVVSGDATLNNSGTLTLSNVVSAATLGGANAVPTLQIDSKGRVIGLTANAYQFADQINYGIIRVPANSNISINGTGEISLTSSNVVSALGYVPASSTALSNYLTKANNLSDLASSATARSNLGLGALATASSINISTASATGTLPITKGGTGLTVSGTANQFLAMNNTGSALEYKTVSAGANISIINSAGQLVISSSNSGGTVTNVTASAPLVVANSATTPSLSLNLSNELITSGTSLALNATGVAANTYGSSSLIPVLTVDEKGRITSASSIAVNSSQWITSGTTINYLSGRVGIGTENPLAPLDISGNSGWIRVQQSSADTNGAAIGFAKSRGTVSAPSAVVTGDRLMGIYAGGYHSGGAFGGNAGAIQILAAENFTATAQGSTIDFGTTAISTTARVTRMTISNNGNVGIGTATPAQKLSVSGVIESTNGGIKFPDGSIQTTATVGATGGDWGFKKGPFSWASAYKMSWSAGGGNGTSLNCMSDTHGCTVLITGTYEVSCYQRANGSSGNPFIGIAVNGNRSTLEAKTNAVWNHDHEHNSMSYSQSNYLGQLTAGELITCGAPDSSTAALLTQSSFSADGSMYIRRVDGAVLGSSQFTTSGSAVFYNGGNLGLGTTSPVYKVDIVGDVNVSGNFKINGVNISNASGTVTQITAGVGLNGGTITSQGTISLPSLITAGTIGASDTVPVISFDAFGRITSISSATTSVLWSNVIGEPTTLAGYGITDALSNSLASGSILVGSAIGSATARTISGDATLSNTGVLTLANTTVAAGTYGASNSVPVFTVDSKGRITGVTSATVASGVSSQWTTSGTTINYMTGNVGIGTSSPNNILDINASGSPVINLSGTSQPGIKVSAGGANGVVQTLSGSEVVFGSLTNHPVTLRTNTNTINMYLSTNGNVGIGTSTPDTKLNLSIAGTGAAYTGSGSTQEPNFVLARIQNTNAAGAASPVFGGFSVTTSIANGGLSQKVYFGAVPNDVSGSYSPNFVIGQRTGLGSYNERLRIDSSGNVGIGTTTPSTNLDVSGTIKISGGSPGAGKVLTSDASGLASWQTPTSITPAGANRAIQYNNNGSFGADNFFNYDSATGRLAIGTSSVGSTKLQVNQGGGNLATTFTKAMDITYGGNSGLSLGFRGDGNSITVQGFEMQVVSGKPLYLGNAGAPQALTIDGIGNVGIGTTTPASNLDVSGTLRLTNGLSTTCSAANEGAQRYNSSTKVMQFCNGTSWNNFGSTYVESAFISYITTGQMVFNHGLATLPKKFGAYLHFTSGACGYTAGERVSLGTSDGDGARQATLWANTTSVKFYAPADIALRCTDGSNMMLSSTSIAYKIVLWAEN